MAVTRVKQKQAGGLPRRWPPFNRVDLTHYENRNEGVTCP